MFDIGLLKLQNRQHEIGSAERRFAVPRVGMTETKNERRYDSPRTTPYIVKYK